MKKIIATILLVCLITSILVPVRVKAAENVNNSNVPQTYIGLKQFVSRNINGTLNLDVEAAIEVGFDVAKVNSVVSHFENINSMVLEDRATTDEQLNIYIKSLPKAARAAGVNKVVTHWWGQTDVYMNSSETAKLQNNLSNIAYISGIPGFVFLPAAILSFGMATYERQINMAASAGRGIIMHIAAYDAITQTQAIWFTGQ